MLFPPRICGSAGDFATLCCGKFLRPRIAALVTSTLLCFVDIYHITILSTCCHIHDVLGELIGVTGPFWSSHDLNMAWPGLVR